jgi:hypothetical protein
VMSKSNATRWCRFRVRTTTKLAAYELISCLHDMQPPFYAQLIFD